MRRGAPARTSSPVNQSVLDARARLRELGGAPVPLSGSRFFKDGAEGYSYGLPAATLREFARQQFARRPLSQADALAAAEELLKSGINDEAVVAVAWVTRHRKTLSPSDLEVFEKWLERFVLNWGTCDDLAINILGELFSRHPRLLPRLKKWAKSERLWTRRASATSLIYSLRRGQNAAPCFAIASILMNDPEDLVQKGYGWMLKEATKRFPTEVRDYILANRRRMPRTALRYAVEKFPQTLRARLMRRD